MEVAANAIPAHPFMLTGQMTTSDPTRSPVGTEAHWAYTHVLQHASRDAGPGDVRGVWDRDDLERFADRMQSPMEQYAPGFDAGAQLVVGRRGKKKATRSW